METPQPPPTRDPRLRGLGFCLLALLLLGFHVTVSRELLGDTALDLGRSFNAPTQGLGRYLAFWLFFGGLAAVSLTRGLHLLLAPRVAALREVWAAGSDRKWLVYGTVFAVLVPAALRTFLLEGLPITDDEGAYRFMAQMVARGRSWVESPPLGLFFDNRFLVNDGKMYAHYFLGWPALMVPGIWLGLGGFVNAFYAAAAVPPLFWTARRIAGSAWARVALGLYLLSPMVMVAAATELSHTSCITALAWFGWCCLRAEDDDSRLGHHAGAALAFSIAFFIRPTSALGVGLPFLLRWAWCRWHELRRGQRGESLRRVVAFALPASALATLFLAINVDQTGSPFTVAYQRAFEYARDNDFRFSPWPGEEQAFTEMQWVSAGYSLAVAGTAFFRLNLALFGWPISLLFALVAGRGPIRNLLAASVVCFFALHALAHNVGIDTFAPMHYVELAWPLLLLTVAGLDRSTRWLAELRGPATTGLAATPALLAIALTVVTAAAYLPFRLGVIARIVDDVARPYEALAEAEIERGVIFASDPFVAYCAHRPTRGWVFARPNNDPWLENDVLWVNHLSQGKNRLLMERLFPDRRGYVMVWDRACRVAYLPLDQLPPGTVPDAPVEGIEAVGVEP